MKQLRLSCAALLCAAAVAGTAAENPDEKIRVVPTGRILMDAAGYFPSDEGFAAGVAIPEIALGVRGSYRGWTARVDVGYCYDKLSMRDVFVQYDFDGVNSVRGGYYVLPFGLTSTTTNSVWYSMESPVAALFFGAGARNIGLMYRHDGERFYAAAAGMIAGTSLNSPANEQGKSSYGATGRFVWRPARESGRIVQAGVSLWGQSALHKRVTDESTGEAHPGPGYFDFKANFPTRVSRVAMLGANVSDARSVIKVSPEILLAKGRVAAEGQYYFMSVGRKEGLRSYRASGCYAMVRCLAIGKGYSYNGADAKIATPAAGSLEFVGGYGYTDGSCGAAGVRGGRAHDFSLTGSYHINRYVVARLRWGYTKVSDSDVTSVGRINTLQARLQVIF